MKVALFGATGMVGQGVLRECLQDAAVSQVVCIGRTPLGTQHPKIEELVKEDLFALDQIEGSLSGLDACFFCLGVSSNGMSEESYRHLTYDMTLSVAGLLARINPNMTFVYVSGAGTDSSERGRSMWARVKGATENALLRLPFKAAYMFRPGVIVPLDGIRSKTASYRLFYTLLGALLPPLQRLFPRSISTTRTIGLAMLQVARHGAQSPILGPADIHAAASSETASGSRHSLQ
ncbi:epimerase [Dyella humicola]|uniref:epimerase n=1 Tax=Dyella humicola TaxID=2992126 RepID=UPI0022571966|nr:epimerase [Dyella humicola]